MTELSLGERTVLTLQYMKNLQYDFVQEKYLYVLKYSIRR